MHYCSTKGYKACVLFKNLANIIVSNMFITNSTIIYPLSDDARSFRISLTITMASATVDPWRSITSWSPLDVLALLDSHAIIT